MFISKLNGSNLKAHNTITINVKPIIEIPYPLNVDTKFESLHNDIHIWNCTIQKYQCHILKENVESNNCFDLSLPTSNWAWSLQTKK
jgi:hypothetical protein